MLWRKTHKKSRKDWDRDYYRWDFQEALSQEVTFELSPEQEAAARPGQVPWTWKADVITGSRNFMSSQMDPCMTRCGETTLPEIRQAHYHFRNLPLRTHNGITEKVKPLIDAHEQNQGWKVYRGCIILHSLLERLCPMKAVACLCYATGQMLVYKLPPVSQGSNISPL